MRARDLALLLSFCLCLPSNAMAQPTPPAAGAIGGAMELPEFDLAAAATDLERQLSLHRDRLATAQDELRRRGTDPTLSVIVDQLQFRISLLEIVLRPLPSPALEGQARIDQLTLLRADRDVLSALAERGKSQGIGAQNQSMLEARLTELDALIESLQRGDTTAPASPAATPPAQATPPGQPAEPPQPGGISNVPPTEVPTPPRLTLGDLMSALTNLATRIEEVRELPQPLQPERVFVIPASTLFPGNGNGPVRRAISRGYFADLRAFIDANTALLGALNSAGYGAEDAIGILVDENGNVVVFVDR